MKARSTWAGTSRTLGNAATPWTAVARGLTGYTTPWNLPSKRFKKSRPPIAPGSREAPMTAITSGTKNDLTAFAAAVMSRSSK